MSLLSLVQVGVTTGQAAINAVDQYGADEDTLVLRLSVIRLLLVQQEDVTADGDEKFLLDAYRDWLNVAARYLEPGSDATEREYSRAAAILLAELRLAGAAASADPGRGTEATASTAGLL
jgi:hypothetical protein